MLMRLVILALTCAVVRSVEFKDCDYKNDWHEKNSSVAGKFDKVEISDCDMSATSCILKKGTDASIGLHFTPNKPTSRVTAVVHGIIEDIDVPFPIPNAEACFDNHSGITCPLAAEAGTSYHATFPVLAKYPTVSVTVKWELKDERGNNIVCLEIPVSIQ